MSAHYNVAYICVQHLYIYCSTRNLYTCQNGANTALSDICAASSADARETRSACIPSPMSDRLPLSYIVLAVSVRVGIALLTRSYFQPDEYFQSLEVAHHLVFGYGHLTWEWLSETPIRSILYPALNVPLYWTLKTLQLDQTSLLVSRTQNPMSYAEHFARFGRHESFMDCLRHARISGYVHLVDMFLACNT